MRNLEESTRNRKFYTFYLTWIKVSPSHRVWNVCSRAQRTNEYKMEHTFFFALSDTYIVARSSQLLQWWFFIWHYHYAALFSRMMLSQIKDSHFVNKISFVGSERRKPSHISRVSPEFPHCAGFPKAVSNAAGNILTVSHANSFPLKSLKRRYGKQPDGE